LHREDVLAETLKGKGNLRYMMAIEEPLLLLVGKDDKVTPSTLSEALFNASPLPVGRKSMAIVDGASHNDVLLKPAAMVAYQSFLSSLP